MNTVTLLVQGYAKEMGEGQWLATSNTTLIQTDKYNIIVDPGTNKELLLTGLQTNNLTPDDIHYVFLTHYHPDHAMLMAVFEQATILDGATMFEKDKETPYQEYIPDTDIAVIPTPGHTPEHHSLLVPTQDNGQLVVAGDLFWWTEGEEQQTDYDSLMNKQDPFMQDEATLKESRAKILEIADWIIPGHGQMFAVSRS